MNESLQAGGLIVSGLLLTLGVIGALSAHRQPERQRAAVLMAVAAALALAIVGRRHHHSAGDLLGWTLVLATLVPLFRAHWEQRSSSATAAETAGETETTT